MLILEFFGGESLKASLGGRRIVRQVNQQGTGRSLSNQSEKFALGYLSDMVCLALFYFCP